MELKIDLKLLQPLEEVIHFMHVFVGFCVFCLSARKGKSSSVDPVSIVFKII